MQRITTTLALIGLLLGIAGSAIAAIDFTPDVLPGGDILAGESAPVFYTNYSGSYPSMQIDASLASNDPFGFTASYALGDLPDSTTYPGLRLVERVENNTGVPWTTFQVTFDNPVSIFDVTGIPDTYSITGSIPNFVGTDAPGIATFGVTASTVGLTFASPIATGQSFGMYVAFSPNDYATGGATHVTQTPNVPEPSTIFLAAMAIVACAGWRLVRRGNF